MMCGSVKPKKQNKASQAGCLFLTTREGTTPRSSSNCLQVPATPWTGSEPIETINSYNGLSHTTYGAYSPDTGLGEAFPGVGVTVIPRARRKSG
jgi:hypothetical protein